MRKLSEKHPTIHDLSSKIGVPVGELISKARATVLHREPNITQDTRLTSTQADNLARVFGSRYATEWEPNTNTTTGGGAAAARDTAAGGNWKHKPRIFGGHVKTYTKEDFKNV